MTMMKMKNMFFMWFLDCPASLSPSKQLEFGETQFLLSHGLIDIKVFACSSHLELHHESIYVIQGKSALYWHFSEAWPRIKNEQRKKKSKAENWGSPL